jgi:hypothetical protein
MTGRLLYTLAHSALGAIVTHALVSEAGTHVVSVESGELLVWDLATRAVISSERILNIRQVRFSKSQDKVLAVSSSGAGGSFMGQAVVRTFPAGSPILELEWPFRKFVEVVWTADEDMIVCYGWDKLKPTMFVFSAADGAAISRFPVKYPGMKEAHRLVPLPDRPGTVALVDAGQAALLEVTSRRFLRSVPGWDGQCSSDGRFGLFAPPSGGMDLLDLRTGAIVRTLIPKVAEGIFEVIAIFNATNE